MRREIRSGQYSFMFAQNGVEALEVLSEEQDIDMVLSDINMPRMDGLTLLGANPQGRSQHPLGHRLGIRRHEEHPHGHEPGSV